MATLNDSLIYSARRAPKREALIAGGVRYTYAELDVKVSQAANALRALGATKGDRLALMSPNTKEFVITFYAAMRLGLVVAPVNPRMAAPEVTYILNDSGARVFVFDPSLAAVARPAHDAAKDGSTILLASRPMEGVRDLDTLASTAPSDTPDVVVTEQDDAEILYTSGTTGFPKGVLLDHHRVIWSGLNVNLATGIHDGDRALHVAPLYHSAALNLFLNGGITVGATHVLMTAFDPAAVLETMEKERITAFFGVPTMYRFMMDRPEFKTRDLSEWRVGMFGAAPMAPADIQRLARMAPNVTLHNLCGPTEGGPGGIGISGERMLANPSANGWAIINTEARVVDHDDHDVKPGETGEIVLRGESVMKGYWNKPEATADTLRNGWLHTGDVGRIDAEGCITLVDRMKDMIITGGMNVYSVEVENAIAAHPDVADCAVIGVPNADYGESIVAVITLRAGKTMTLEQLRAHCRTLIADYKAPHRMVIDVVPRNPSGKIVKHTLREKMIAQLAD